jgi:hypothetical protein
VVPCNRRAASRGRIEWTEACRRPRSRNREPSNRAGRNWRNHPRPCPFVPMAGSLPPQITYESRVDPPRKWTVIDVDRCRFAHFEKRFGRTNRHCNALGSSLNRREQQVARGRVVRPHRNLQIGVVGNDVMLGTGVKRTDGNDSWRQRLLFTSNNTLQRDDNLRGNIDRILAKLRRGTVGATPVTVKSTLSADKCCMGSNLRPPRSVSAETRRLGRNRTNAARIGRLSMAFLARTLTCALAGQVHLHRHLRHGPFLGTPAT